MFVLLEKKLARMNDDIAFMYGVLLLQKVGFVLFHDFEQDVSKDVDLVQSRGLLTAMRERSRERNSEDSGSWHSSSDESDPKHL